MWDLLEAAAGATIDGVFEEAFTIQPTSPPPSGDRDARRIPNGPAVPFLAVFSEEHVQRFPDARGHASSDAQQFGAGKTRVDFTTAALGFRPALNDVVTRAATSTLYLVADVGGNGFTRTCLVLTAARKI